MKYKVIYISTNDDDCCSVWTEASSPQEAKENILYEYWDAGEIIDVVEL